VDETQHPLANPAAEQMFGCEPGGMLGAPLEQFIPARFRATHRAHIERFGATGATKRRMGGQSILFGLRADGEEFPIEASISQLPEHDSKVYTVILRDVTERLRAQDALDRSQRELAEVSAALVRRARRAAVSHGERQSSLSTKRSASFWSIRSGDRVCTAGDDRVAA
jgi:two-component system sensor kinase